MKTGPKIWSSMRIALLVVALIAGWVGAVFAAPAASAQEELVFCSDIAYPPMESFKDRSRSAPTSTSARDRRAAGARSRSLQYRVRRHRRRASRPSMRRHHLQHERHAGAGREVDFVDYLWSVNPSSSPKGNPLGTHVAGVALRPHRSGARSARRTSTRSTWRANECVTAAGKNRSTSPASLRILTRSWRSRPIASTSVETDSPVAAYYIESGTGDVRVRWTADRPDVVGIAFSKEDTELRDQVQHGGRRDVRRWHDDGHSGEVAVAGLRAARRRRGATPMAATPAMG